jgi:hypothetical protein
MYLVIIQILEVCLGSTIIGRQETIDWTLIAELKGCGDYEVVDWEIVIGDLVNEGRGVKLSHEEESNSLMK